MRNNAAAWWRRRHVSQQMQQVCLQTKAARKRPQLRPGNMTTPIRPVVLLSLCACGGRHRSSRRTGAGSCSLRKRAHVDPHGRRATLVC